MFFIINKLLKRTENITKFLVGTKLTFQFCFCRYVIYQMERRPEIKEMNPDIPFVEVTKILGNEWSNMSPEQKKGAL